MSDDSRKEQSTEEWWNARMFRIRERIRHDVKKAGLTTIKAIAVTSTPGTFIPLDNINRPLHAALMYSDKRSKAEAPRCQETARQSGQEGFTAFNYSCGLSKMHWFSGAFPEKEIGRAHV